jgi:hypothetical protein
MSDYEEDDYYYDDESVDYEEKDDIVDYAAYRDIGEFGRLGGQVDEDLDMALGSAIDGAQQRYDLIIMPPEEKFKIEIVSLLKNEIELKLSEMDKKVIKTTIKKLPFIEYKNPLLYILGYYIYLDMRLDSSISNVLKNKFKIVQRYIQENPNITMFEIIKYARYWKFVLT